METNLNVTSNSFSTRKLVVMAMLSAISIVFVSLIHFPLFPAAAFLEYDPADIPIILGAMMYGPVAGVLITIVVSIIQGMTVSAHSGIIGIIMHIFATGICAFTVGAIYSKRRTRQSAILGLSLGAVFMTIAMVIMNLILTPLFMGAPIEMVIDMLVPIIIPFNFIKSGLNCTFAYIIFTFMEKIIKLVTV